jgi:hypothetical protein
MNVLDVLDVNADRSGDRNSADVDSPYDTMPRQKTLAQPIRELQRAEKKRKCTSNSVGQQPPPERLVVLPNGSWRIDQDAVALENDEHHQGDDCEQDILRTWKPRA